MRRVYVLAISFAVVGCVGPEDSKPHPSSDIVTPEVIDTATVGDSPRAIRSEAIQLGELKDSIRSLSKELEQVREESSRWEQSYRDSRSRSNSATCCDSIAMTLEATDRSLRRWKDAAYQYRKEIVELQRTVDSLNRVISRY